MTGAAPQVGQTESGGLEKIVDAIGPRVRELRASQKLSLQQLAVRAEVSAAAIHKVERGEMVPTITTLLKLASALGEPVGSFIEDVTPRYPVAVHSVAKGRGDSVPFTGPASQFLLNGAVTVIEPGADGVAEPVRASASPGEEVVFVLDGALEFHVADQEFKLARHDSLHFRTDHLRQWHNRGRKPVRVLWLSLPAS